MEWICDTNLVTYSLILYLSVGKSKNILYLSDA